MHNSAKVLIVDDSRVSRMLISAIVKSKHPDWPILEACNGAEALEKAQSNAAIRLIILDYNMPGMDGLTLAKSLRLSHPTSFISLLTANVQNSTRDKTRDLGIYFAPKPITEERVVEIMNAMG